MGDVPGWLALMAEATGAIVVPCSATIVVTGVLLAPLTRGRTSGLVALVTGTALGAVVAVAWGWVPAAPVIGLAMVGGGLLAARSGPPGDVRAVAAAVGTGMAGAAAGWLWQPCVGEHLGVVLTTAVRRPWWAVLALVAYVVVLVVPALVVGMLARSPRLATRLGRGARTAAMLVVVALGLAVVVGLGDELTAALFRWSTGLAAS